MPPYSERLRYPERPKNKICPFGVEGTDKYAGIGITLANRQSPQYAALEVLNALYDFYTSEEALPRSSASAQRFTYIEAQPPIQAQRDERRKSLASRLVDAPTPKMEFSFSPKNVSGAPSQKSVITLKYNLGRSSAGSYQTREQASRSSRSADMQGSLDNFAVCIQYTAEQSSIFAERDMLLKYLLATIPR